jgi:hypothetical protein
MVGRRAGERARLELAGDVDQLVALGRGEVAGVADQARGAAALMGCQGADVTAGEQRELEDRDDLEQW